ncbi:hypothetical protein HEPPS_04690 [Candidatus Hepatoplasma crinochetorum]|uniref:Antitoxin SocA-like Panacea domain-containing protein n=1 Tax=Candidatus Hepatoplasma crinochetorum TaxID=295596 RepID=A0A0G7ZNM9_9MOLU|nr:hypothetical protein HEPPS_04690 [Candidatus Hepatoplasma crinochetorum]
MNDLKISINDKIIEFAKYIIWKYKEENISAIKLQKILFFIRYEEKKNKIDSKIFKDNYNFEAWVNGPVNSQTYIFFRPYFYEINDPEEYIPNNKYISEFRKYDKYIKKYVYENKWDLVKKSHKNLGWIEARRGLKKSEITLNKRKINEEKIT